MGHKVYIVVLESTYADEDMEIVKLFYRKEEAEEYVVKMNEREERDERYYYWYDYEVE